MSDNNLAQVINEAAATLSALRSPAVPTTEPVVLLPHYVDVRSLEQYQARPSRVRDSVIFNQVESFVDFYNKFAPVFTPFTKAYAKNGGVHVQTIFDYHTVTDGTDALMPEALPAFGHFTATLELDEDTELKVWRGNNNNFMPQMDFVEFIDANLHNIVTPEAAELLEMLQLIEGTRNAVFRSGQRLTNGQVSLAYDEDIQTTGGKKKMTLPSEIHLSIRFFKHSPRRDVTVRLRYRITEKGGVFFCYQIPQLEDLMELAYNEVVEQVKTGTKTAVYWTKN